MLEFRASHVFLNMEKHSFEHLRSENPQSKIGGSAPFHIIDEKGQNMDPKFCHNPLLHILMIKVYKVFRTSVSAAHS